MYPFYICLVKKVRFNCSPGLKVNSRRPSCKVVRLAHFFIVRNNLKEIQMTGSRFFGSTLQP